MDEAVYRRVAVPGVRNPGAIPTMKSIAGMPVTRFTSGAGVPIVTCVARTLKLKLCPAQTVDTVTLVGTKDRRYLNLELVLMAGVGPPEGVPVVIVRLGLGPCTLITN